MAHSSSNFRRSGHDGGGSGGRRPASRTASVLSVLFLIGSIAVPSAFATQQMSYLRAQGPDLHGLGVAICLAGTLIGVVSFLLMRRRAAGDRNGRAASLAVLAGTVIFAVGALVIAGSSYQTVAPTGGVEDSRT